MIFKKITLFKYAEGVSLMVCILFRVFVCMFVLKRPVVYTGLDIHGRDYIIGHALQNESSSWPFYTRQQNAYNTIFILVAQWMKILCIFTLKAMRRIICI